jgi:hypothetical protein
MGFLLSYLLAFLMLLAGNRGRTDLLDTMSTDVYWQIKHVAPDAGQLERDASFEVAPASIAAQLKDLEAADFATRDRARQELERMGPTILPLLKPATQSPDPEVAAVAQELVKKFSERGQERSIRRLMAIRTLGERGEKGALPLLNTLKDSRELFVGDYARRAVARINDERYVPADLSEKLASDVALLPGDAALVGQSWGLDAQPLTIGSLVGAALANDSGGRMALVPGAAPAEKPDAKMLERRVSERLLALLERIGNLRMDGVTVGFNDVKDNAGERGWVAVVIRGQYSTELAVPALREMIGGNAVVTPAAKPGDTAMLTDRDGQTSVLLPNNELLIFITSSDGKSGQAVRETVLKALQNGPGAAGENKELASLIKTVDTKSPLWLVCRPNDMMRKDMDLDYKTLTVGTKMGKAGTEFTVQVETEDADKTKALLETMTRQLKDAQDEVKQEAAVTPSLKPVGDLLDSIKLTGEGVHGTMTGRLPTGALNALLGQLPLTELLAPDEGPPVQVAPPQPGLP